MPKPFAVPSLPAAPAHGDVLYPAAALALAIFATAATAGAVARFTATLPEAARRLVRATPRPADSPAS